MNFPHFGGHFSGSIPSIHQFAAKIAQENGSEATFQDNSNRYTPSGVPSFTQHQPAMQQQLVNVSRYNGNYLNSHSIYNTSNKKQSFEQQETTQELCTLFPSHQDKFNNEKVKIPEDTNSKHNLQQENQTNQPSATSPAISSAWQSLTGSGSTVVDYLSQLPTSTLPLSLHHFLKYSAETLKKETVQQLTLQSANETNLTVLPNSSTVHLPGGELGSSIRSNQLNNMSGINGLSTINTAHLQNPVSTKRKKKKKQEKEKKIRPKPGEIRLTTALDGSTLYCCPECHMAYPEKELLEQHLVGHTLERRFVCDICGAGLKRKDHLTRHKQSHNPERPYVCTVCLKAFKRKEQLTLHFVIHSGEKRHICNECGKGFYRKDHLRKHTRSHIARRVKAELSQQGNGDQNQVLQVPAPSSNNMTVEFINGTSSTEYTI